MSENYSCKDPYETSLNALLSYLKNEAPSTGFAVGSKGEGENRTHGLALCRGDLSPMDCSNCVEQAINDMLKDCPYNKVAMILHEDCTVEYSNEDYFGQTMHNSMLCLTSTNNVSDPSPEWFDQKTQEFLSIISQEAVLDPNLYATGKSEIDEYSTIYGYAQCNRDLSRMDCNECLNDSLAYLKACDEKKEGVRVYSGICRVRYEIYPFLHDEHSSTPPPTSSPTPDANSPYPAPEDGSAHGLETGIFIFIGLLSLFSTHCVI
ncbi:cysteine-rich repeat secretory protein 38-like [Gastrolobium bilobum]|uniref:cysteine-rich repeat secretory protein 38-like n=1 Tax=Gastrolobium bilobum TaxID=150636 RepID=UPI002AB242F1|nr:cysteine-rich repeat secretory protein 38-like [Gastrolobium bilobum]